MGLGRRITQSTDDHRESAFLFQLQSVLIQRYNAVAVLGTFVHSFFRYCWDHLFNPAFNLH